MKAGYSRGETKGISKGREKSKVKIVTRILSMNKTVGEIHEYTGIPIKHIKRIKNSLSK